MFGRMLQIGMLGAFSYQKALFTASASNVMFSPLVSKYPEVGDMLRNTQRNRNLQQSTISNTAIADSTLRNELFYNFQLPIYYYVDSLLHRYRSNVPGKPLFFGISAPQGCGKTALTSIMCDMFRSEGISCISMSIDDFYLTGIEQDQLAKMHKQNKLLEFRGNAGTHDLDLTMKTLHALATMKSRTQHSNSDDHVSNKTVYVPSYDKSLRHGKGDRAPFTSWKPITESVDVVLFEGWMLGFTPFETNNHKLSNSSSCLTNDGNNMSSSSITGREWNDIDNTMLHHLNDTSASTTINYVGNEGRSSSISSVSDVEEGIKEINELLRPYEALHHYMDAWLILAVENTEWIYEWRLGAERAMKQRLFQQQQQEIALQTSDDDDKDGRNIGLPATMNVSVNEDNLWKENGMSDAQVAEFVSRFMPAYQKYLPVLYNITHNGGGGGGPQRSAFKKKDYPFDDNQILILQEQQQQLQSSDYGGSNAEEIILSPVLKVSVNRDRLPIKVECS